MGGGPDSKQRPCFKCLPQHLSERTKGNHYKTACQDSSFEVTKFREPYLQYKTGSLTTKGNFIKNSLTWFSKQRDCFNTAQLNTAQIDMPLSKKIPQFKIKPHNKFLKWKPTRCTISQIYLIKYSTCFGQVHCPSSGVSQHCIHAIGICQANSVGCLLAWSG
jgi:hypothetical protein